MERSEIASLSPGPETLIYQIILIPLLLLIKAMRMDMFIAG